LASGLLVRMDATQTKPAAILHSLANALNGVFIIVQLQERYLGGNPETVHGLISETIKDLKEELEQLQRLVEDLKAALEE
jgi:hypothetical protein